MEERRPPSMNTNDEEEELANADADADANVFSDDYAESTTDSFADTADAHSVQGSTLDEPTTLLQSILHFNATAPAEAGRQASNRSSVRSRPSIAKDYRNNPFDDAQGPRMRPSPRSSLLIRHGSHATASRSQSSTSSAFARSPSTIQSQSGPSHPYALYPQALGVSRSASNASTSTYYREPTQANSPQTPSHPYALYPQNVFSDDHEIREPASIPVGFLQNNQSFHRRIGPEGEEQDIVGPDGHTEQLPPYTRYPEEIHSKASTGSDLPRIGETIGWEGTRQHEARPAVRSPQSPVFSPASVHNEEASSLLRTNSHGVDQNRSDFTEKSWSEKNWKERRKTRVLGRPLWCCILALVVGVLVVAVIGAVIGSVVGRNGVERHYAAAQSQTTSTTYSVFEDKQSQSVTATTTILVDASRMTTTATSVPTLQPGKYPMRLGWSTYNTSGCLQQSDEQSAWSCALASPAVLLSIEQLGKETTASLLPAYPNEPLGYGSQLPFIGSSQKLQLVIDNEAVDLGPAYQFQLLYDKLVILPSWALSPNASSTDSPMDKRGTAMPPNGWTSPFTRHPIQSGDEPWFCHWNQTFLEAFFYVENPPPASAFSSTAAYSSSGRSSSYSTPTVSSTGSSTQRYSASSEPFSTSEAYIVRRQGSDAESTSADTTFQYSGDWHGMTRPPKVEERRLGSTHAPAGSCQQMQWSHNLQHFVPKLNSSDQPIVVTLDEKDPKQAPIYKKEKRSPWWPARYSEKHKAEEEEEGGCYCQWHLLQPYYGPARSTFSS